MDTDAGKQVDGVGGRTMGWELGEALQSLLLFFSVRKEARSSIGSEGQGGVPSLRRFCFLNTARLVTRAGQLSCGNLHSLPFPHPTPPSQ